MKKIVGVLLGLGLVVALALAGTPKANAGWPGGKVTNESGYSVSVKMDGGKVYTAWEGQSSTLWGRDANQFRVNRDWRCIRGDKGDFKVKPGNYFKIGNLDHIYVSAYTYAKCGSKPWLSTRYTRV
jgi:hypothetical protein